MFRERKKEKEESRGRMCKMETRYYHMIECSKMNVQTESNL